MQTVRGGKHRILCTVSLQVGSVLGLLQFRVNYYDVNVSIVTVYVKFFISLIISPHACCNTSSIEYEESRFKVQSSHLDRKFQIAV